MRLRVVAASATAIALLSSGCGIARVDAPITFKADRRLKIVVPEVDDEVALPVTVRWTVKDFEPTEGRRFALFVDKLPIKTGHLMRIKICGDRDREQPAPGEQRQACKDDRERVVQTTATSYTFDCIKPREFVGESQRNVHTVAVFLLGADGRREGTAAYSVRFEIKKDEALRGCAGFGGA